jgi:CRP-like cAMP-binding protein
VSKQEKAAPWSALSEFLPTRRVETGQLLILEDQPAETLFLIEEGQLEVRLATPRGEVKLGTKGPGEWVGETGLLSPGVGSATVLAMGPGKVRALTHDGYLDLSETQPRAVGEALYHVVADLARRVRRSADVQAEPGLDLTMSQIRALQGIGRPDVGAAESPRRAADKQMPHVDGTALLRTLTHLGVFASKDARGATRAAGLQKALAALAQTGLSVQTYLHGEPILQAGERADGAFILLGGQVKVEAGAKGGPLAVETHLEPGTLFGHQAFFDDHKRQATVTSVGASVVAVMWSGAVQEILRQAQAGTPLWLPLLDWFAQRLAQDARGVTRRLKAALGA